MVYILVDGEKKKVACGPCIRGHRSSKCEHKDRILLEVRKPGRPLSSCPHPAGSCNCDRIVINYTIPKSVECSKCSPNDPIPADSSITKVKASEYNAQIGGPTGANRIQKSKRKSVIARPTSTIERAVKEFEEGGSETIERKPDQPKPSGNSSPLTSSGGASPKTSSGSTSHDVSPLLEGQTNGPVNVPNGPNQPRLRLGLMGVGGAGAGPDVIGWDSQWPSLSALPSNHTAPGKIQAGNQQATADGHQTNSLMPSSTRKSCCGGGASTSSSSGQTAMPNTQMAQLPGLNFQHTDPYSYASMEAATPFIHPAAHSMTQSGITPLSSGVPQHTCGAMSHPDGSGSNAHNCNCGDSCECLGCAAHPQNATTIQWVKKHSEFMVFGGEPSSPQLAYMPYMPHQPLVGFETLAQHQRPPGMGHDTHSYLFDPFQQMQIPVNGHPHGQWAQDLSSMARLPGSAMQQFDAHRIPTAVQQSHDVSTPHALNGFGSQSGPTSPTTPRPLAQHSNPVSVDHPSTTLSLTENPYMGTSSTLSPPSHPTPSLASHDHHSQQQQHDDPINTATTTRMSAPTLPALDDSPPAPATAPADDAELSPSSYFFNSIVLPGCSENNGLCQCGDGCLCAGCLMHGGHNGVDVGFEPAAEADDVDVDLDVGSAAAEAEARGGGVSRTMAEQAQVRVPKEPPPAAPPPSVASPVLRQEGVTVS
ncbi:hypothetical protein BDY21DRAFT_148227 [Lineolata rhizophorae]|uniref:Copper-fist domain-containing protein n=1 Tax=Lineolata rhizophorae TaxID=578093 RepID=A0A6A6NMR1_9PEZI|nr:hypothetical protein BDY21DRAFT_148227 [Lineolata rhizophorae]